MTKVRMQATEQCCLFLMFLFMKYGLILSGGECPCRMDIKTKTADCRIRRLSAVPDCVPRTVTKLLFGYNELYKISPRQFEKYNELLYLNLKNNHISYLSDEAFTGLPVLNKLILRNNHLSVLNTTAFDRLSKLQILDLMGNEIKEIQDNIFSVLSNLRQVSLRLTMEFLKTHFFCRTFFTEAFIYQ